MSRAIQDDKWVQEQHGPDADARTGLDDLEEEVQAGMEEGEGVEDDFGDSDEDQEAVEDEECAEYATSARQFALSISSSTPLGTLGR